MGKPSCVKGALGSPHFGLFLGPYFLPFASNTCIKHIAPHFLPHIQCMGNVGPLANSIQAHPISPIHNIASIRLGAHSLLCEVSCWVLLRMPIVYACFVSILFTGLNISLNYNVPPLIAFSLTFSTFLTFRYPLTHFSHRHNVHSKLQIHHWFSQMLRSNY